MQIIWVKWEEEFCYDNTSLFYVLLSESEYLVHEIKFSTIIWLLKIIISWEKNADQLYTKNGIFSLRRVHSPTSI